MTGLGLFSYTQWTSIFCMIGFAMNYYFGAFTWLAFCADNSQCIVPCSHDKVGQEYKTSECMYVCRTHILYSEGQGKIS